MILKTKEMSALQIELIYFKPKFPNSHIYHEGSLVKTHTS